VARRLTALVPQRVRQMVGLEARDDRWERSRARWRAARPDAGLTWGVELSGDEFVERAAAHGAFGAGRTVLEVGPGYGRLLRSALDGGHEFSRWIGLDLSEANVAHLRGAFDDERVEFRHADAESADLGESVDTVVSSLTFKHMFPSFEGLLANVARQVSPGGLVLFDLIEGERRYFEDDGVTYIRHYLRAEIEQILEANGLELVAFEKVQHHPDLVRLLVVARRP
jgi:SAM-dependent methyltransferase